MADTSTPQQREFFKHSISTGIPNNTWAVDCNQCVLGIGAESCAILDIQYPATYQKAAQVLANRASGGYAVY